MPMSKAKKEQEVQDMRDLFGKSGVIVVAHYSGLSVPQIEDLRGRLREQGATFKVTKNTLAKLALKGTEYEGISDLLSGPTGVAVSEDPIAAAKIANDFAKDNDKLVIVGGAMGPTVLDAKGVQRLAKMPSLDELRGTLIGLLQAPATKIARVLQAPAQQMVGVTKAYGEKS